MSAAACLIIPFGSMSSRARQAIFRGLFLGFAAGAGVWSALTYGGRSGGELAKLAVIYVVVTTAMCLAVSLLFWHLGKKRRRLAGDG